MAIKLFGFTLGNKDVVQLQNPEQPSFALPTEALDDGAVTITQNAYYGTYVDLEGAVRNELELITRYREMANHPELEMAIDDIVNEAITHDVTGRTVDIILDKLKQPETIKKKIIEEFENVLKMLNFGNLSDDLFKRWYIDGRIYYHVVIDESNPKNGIQELRYIDPRKIRKVREIKKMRDPKSGAQIIQSIAEYYVYNDRAPSAQSFTSEVNSGLRIATESVINVNSGMMDAKNTFVISYLHKAIKPLNQLRMIEDAVVIYRISRAPERRIFYIDVGNLPKGKAEQYLRDVMLKYRNKMVYDAQTGELRDDRKHMSMLEDFWLPRREGGKGTEITTLPAGQNLGELEDVKYFRQKLLQSLNVPISRLEPQQGGMIGLGRTTEVTRDEVKFTKFIIRLRNKFSQIFDHALRIQLVLKGICTSDEWDKFREDIYYDYKKDNNFTELRDAELLRERLGLLQVVDPYIGRYYSSDWVKRKILQLSDEDISQMDKQIAKEDKAGTGGPTIPIPGQEQQQAETDANPPVDNTAEEDSTESKTPMLDADAEKLASRLNKK
jgi:Bacteriophage T4-like portal protein (Gp20)